MKKQESEKYDTKRWVTIVDDFRKLLNEVESLKNMIVEDIKEGDLAFGDIRHYVELNYPTERSEKTKVCQSIKEYMDSRRQAKDAFEVLKPFLEMHEANRKLNTIVGKCANEMIAAQKRKESDKVYRPRILSELFNKKK